MGVFLGGARCADDTPAALAGRAEPSGLVDPARTLDGVRAAKGLPVEVVPGRNASAVIEERNRVSGKTASRSTRAKVRAS